MSTVRLDAQSPSQAAYALPSQVLAARQRQNSVTPQATDTKPPEAAEKAARPALDTRRDEVLGKDGQRRPPPPLKEYARIPTAVTAEILRLQEEALEKATEAEEIAETARATASNAEAAESAARAAEAAASTPDAAPASTADAPAPERAAVTGYAQLSRQP